MPVDDVIGRIRISPDAGLVHSLGANHTLESALADLVDNSIDAGASRVSVRLLTEDERLVEVQVIDNGRGMDSAIIDNAMRIGHQREYEHGQLGHFGMGLKAASFGHCDVLTVWSSSEDEEAAGRRIRKADFSKDFSCEVLSPSAGDAWGHVRKEVVGSARGTTVVWTGVKNAYRGTSSAEATSWLSERAAHVRSYLGVTFHRLLEGGRVEIDVLVDERADATGMPGVPVHPIDPFGYANSGHPGYPKTLEVEAAGHRVALGCHIWPAKTDVTGFRIGSKSGDQFQGFFIYRHDRLLQIGGWSDTATSSPARQLARVIIEDTAAIGPFVVMNPEKSGLKFEPLFHDAINRATSADGATFGTFLQDAEATFVEANKRRRGRRPVIRPDKGFAPIVRRRIKDEVPFIPGLTIDLKWRRLPIGEFFEVDFKGRTLWINSRYRRWFAPGGGSLNDAPVLKALIYLLTHHVFEGQVLGSRDKDEIALWNSVLSAAIAAEEQVRGE